MLVIKQDREREREKKEKQKQIFHFIIMIKTFNIYYISINIFY